MITIKAQGLDNVRRRVGLSASKRLRNMLDNTTGKATRQMANDSAKMAPVKDNLLRPSIPASVKKESEMSWSYGSNLPYAKRQEYTHPSKKGFFRKSIWKNRTKFRDAIKDDLRHLGR